MLETEITKRKVEKKKIAESLHITSVAFTMKLSGLRSFSLDEAITIQAKYFGDIPIQELFRKDGET